MDVFTVDVSMVERASLIGNPFLWKKEEGSGIADPGFS